MEITGVDNVVFTASPPSEALRIAVQRLLTDWSEGIVQEGPDLPSNAGEHGERARGSELRPLCVFFYCDQTQVARHDAYGFEPDYLGRGPVALFARSRSPFGAKISSVQEILIGEQIAMQVPDSYPAHMSFGNITEITIVTPTTPVQGSFSASIYLAVIATLAAT